MGAYSDRVIADGATHYWRLGEPSGTTAADSVGSAPGTISGGVTLGQPGPLADGSTAMAFDGTTGKIVMGAVTVPVPVTVEAWGQVPSTVVNIPVFSNAAGGAVDNPIWWGLSAHQLIFVVDQVAGVNGSHVVDDGQWHHLVAVSTATTSTLYLDGVLEATGALSRPTSSVHPGAIAAILNDLAKHWLGALAEVAIYPTALTAPQIAAHYALRTATGGGGGGQPLIPWSLAAVLEMTT